MIKNLNNSNEIELLNCFKALIKDEQDFVRLYLVDSIIAFAKYFNSLVILLLIKPNNPT